MALVPSKGPIDTVSVEEVKSEGPELRSLDQALDTAIRAGVRVDPRREIVTPEALGLTLTEAKEFGRQFVAALLAREAGRQHSDPVDAEWWAHTAAPEEVIDGVYQWRCACGFVTGLGGRYVTQEEHAVHRQKYMEVVKLASTSLYSTGEPGGGEADRSGSGGYLLPPRTWGVRGAGEVQHTSSTGVPSSGTRQRLLERQVEQDRNLASHLLSARGRALRSSEPERQRFPTENIAEPADWDSVQHSDQVPSEPLD